MVWGVLYACVANAAKLGMTPQDLAASTNDALHVTVRANPATFEAFLDRAKTLGVPQKEVPGLCPALIVTLRSDTFTKGTQESLKVLSGGIGQNGINAKVADLAEAFVRTLRNPYAVRDAIGALYDVCMMCVYTTLQVL